MKSNTLAYAIIAASLSGLVSCQFNVFDPFDSPTSDTQLLDAARACLDRGDVECARQNYAKLSSAFSEIAASETAFTALDQAGAGLNTFIEALGNGDAGKGLTIMASKLATLTPGKAKRMEIFNAYKQVDQITTNTELRGLVRFVTAFALAAEILAEDAGSNQSLDKADIVTSPTACDTTSCALAANCVTPSTAVLSMGTNIPWTQLSASESTINVTNPTLGMFNGAIDAINQGINYELASSGKFRTGAGNFSAQLAAAFSLGATGERCYRAQLLSRGVGN